MNFIIFSTFARSSRIYRGLQKREDFPTLGRLGTSDRSMETWICWYHSIAQFSVGKIVSIWFPASLAWNWIVDFIWFQVEDQKETSCTGFSFQNSPWLCPCIQWTGIRHGPEAQKIGENRKTRWYRSAGYGMYFRYNLW